MATQHKLMLLKICPILRLVYLLEKSKEAASSSPSAEATLGHC